MIIFTKNTIYNTLFFSLFFLIFSPFFISLDITNGIKFDAYFGHLYSRPSIPISFFVLSLFTLVKFKSLLTHYHLILLFLVISVFMIFNFYYGIPRAIIVGLGMMLPLISFYIFKIIFEDQKNLYMTMYISLISVIVIKFIFDLNILYNNSFEIDLLLNNNWTDIKLNTPYYITTSIAIYSYYDYFPFIYYVAVVLSVYNLLNKQMIVVSVFLILLSSIVILDTGSRLFIYSIYLTPILYIFYSMLKLKLKTYFYLFTSLGVVITILMGISNFHFSDESLSIRNNLLLEYFYNINFINIIFPFFNDYRLEIVGSLHNEFIEIYSFFGFITFYYYYYLMQIFIEVNDEYQLISFFLMFVIIIGAIVQINVSNPYIAIIIGMILALFTINKNNKNQGEFDD